jgi:hypothetical protein
MQTARTGCDKTVDGKYIRSFMVDGVCCHTRAGVLWYSILQRVRVGSSAQSRRHLYSGVTSKFSDFNAFAVWCNSQVGYMNKDDNGNFWSLDKDIIVPFNKTYSEDTCAFVPNELNCLLVYSSKTRGEYPLGVHFAKREQRFVAQSNLNGVRKFLGYFPDEMTAHRAYQSCKIDKISEMMVKCRGMVDYRVIHGLELHKQLFIEDMTNFRETVR